MRQTNVRLTDRNKKTMEKEYYICEFCQKKFYPNRRKLQKFCSNTCRSKNHYHKHATKSSDAIAVEQSNSGKVEEMSWAGVGNAAAGVFLVNLLDRILTAHNNKNASKQDIEELKNLINNRYYLVHNLPNGIDGGIPYFDILTGKIIYKGEKNAGWNVP